MTNEELTGVKFLTDGVLLREMMDDHLLSKYRFLKREMKNSFIIELFGNMQQRVVRNFFYCEHADTLLEDSPLLESFVKGYDTYRNSRFKMIPYWLELVLRNWLLVARILDDMFPSVMYLSKVALLAFHLALITDPQEAFVVLTFASELYHRNWKEGVKFARRHSDAAIYAPEISVSQGSMSDDELVERVKELLVLEVKKSKTVG